ncbi:hypothetical protein D3C87_1345640 [compost metagenome]
MPPARVIEVVAREGFAPVREHAYQPALRDMLLHQVLRHVGQAQPLQGSLQAHGDVVEHQLALDADVHWLAILLELPRIQPAVSRHAQGDAIVLHQINRDDGL